jgi:hypothetical protein
MCSHGLAERVGGAWWACVSVPLASAVDVYCLMRSLPPPPPATQKFVPYHYILTGAMLSCYDGKGKLLSQTNLFGAAILEDPGHSNAFVVDTGKDKMTMQVARTVLRCCCFFLCLHLWPVCVALTAVVAMCSHFMRNEESEVVRVGVHIQMRLSGSIFVLLSGFLL